MTFNLRALIREVINEGSTIDVRVLADKVAEQVPDEHVRSALAQTLPATVREVLTEWRPKGQQQASSPPASRPFAPLNPSQVPAAPRAVLGGGAPSPRFTGSRKGAEIRDAWQRVLDAPYATAAGQKRLGDCTYDDLQFVAQGLDRLAEQNRARARGFRELAAQLTDHDAKTVRELPAELLMQHLGAR